MNKKRRKDEDIVQLEEEKSNNRRRKKAEQEKDKISFDAYFQQLMRQHMEILAHHKAPMKRFAEGKGLKGPCKKEDFDKIFEKY